MLDIRTIREDSKPLVQALKNRQSPSETLALVDTLLATDEQWRKIKKEEEELRAERNKCNIEIIQLKKAKKNADKVIARSSKISARVKDISEETQQLQDRIRDTLLQLPNLPHTRVPKGKTADDNPEIRRWGEIEKRAGDVQPHDDLAQKKGWIDFDRGVKLAGHRFTVLKGPVARLERALIHFMLGVASSNGYLEVLPPHLVQGKILQGTGQLPKFEEDLYRCRDDDLWLIPTAEVPLTNLFAGEVLDESALPIKLTGYTPCYRREAGAYGKDIKGLIRQHQFNKVELVQFAHPDRSFQELELMVRDAESVLQALGLPYRVVELCTGDLGFAAAKTYDIEVWIPSQNRYREISSCSNCTDFQARRAQIKFRKGGELSFVHTLNGSALAVGRTLVAILENFQQDGVVSLPKVLQDYAGMETLDFR